MRTKALTLGMVTTFMHSNCHGQVLSPMMESQVLSWLSLSSFAFLSTKDAFVMGGVRRELKASRDRGRIRKSSLKTLSLSVYLIFP